MSTKRLPWSSEQVRGILTSYPTPVYLYDEQGIRAAARALQQAFSWAPAFTEYFAVKATPTPRIMALLAAEGCGMDCSSLPELLLSERIGVTGERIMFTSNDTPPEEFEQAHRLGAIINLDDIGHLAILERHTGLPELICFRYNPGPLRAGNPIIGRPEESKFGCTREQLYAGYQRARAGGVRRFGLHTMLASNELNPEYAIATARMLFELAVDLWHDLGMRLEFINLGGGIGIPYHPEQQPVDLGRLGAGVRAAYTELIAAHGLHPLKLMMECGRLITGPHGYLLTTVRHIKQTYKRYVGVDATMANLMRPGMYGAYHHITVLGKEHLPPEATCDVVGSLCENNDRFAIDRRLPAIEPGDVLVIHDAGAHGHAMGFNYNGKLRSAEVLVGAGGTAHLIRRAETLDDYFATLEVD